MSDAKLHASTQSTTLQPIADSWEELPSSTFEGTGVRSVLLTMRAELEDPEPEKSRPQIDTTRATGDAEQLSLGL